LGRLNQRKKMSGTHETNGEGKGTGNPSFIEWSTPPDTTVLKRKETP